MSSPSPLEQVDLHIGGEQAVRGVDSSRSGTDHGNQAALLKRSESMLRRARGKTYVLRDRGRGAAVPFRDVICDSLFNGIDDYRTDWLGPQGDTEAKPQFCEFRLRKPRASTRADRPLYARSPLLDQPQFIEHAREHTIAHTGKALAQLFDREPRQ